MEYQGKPIGGSAGQAIHQLPGEGWGVGGGRRIARWTASINTERENGVYNNTVTRRVIALLLLVDKSGHYGLPEVFVTGI